MQAPTAASALAPVQSPVPKGTNGSTDPVSVTEDLPSLPANDPNSPKKFLSNGHSQSETTRPKPAETKPTPAASPVPPAVQPTLPPSMPAAVKKPTVPSPVKPPTPSTNTFAKAGQNGPSTLPVSQSPLDDATQAEKTKKMQNALTRTIWTLIMIGGFLGTFVSLKILVAIKLYA